MRLSCTGIATLAAFAVRLLAASTPSSAQESLAANRLIVGWNDAVIVCGPGTDAGMDSPEAIQRIVKRWKERGIRGVYWRVDESMLPERFMTRWNQTTSPGANYLFRRVDDVQARFPVHHTLLAAAEREGVEIWAWYPTIYSNGAPAEGPNFTYPWLYENKFGTDHPEIITVDRLGNKQFMIWEYAYPEARRAKVSEFVQFAKDYGFKRFVACLRTEAAQNQPAPRHADQFGFNAPVVAEMRRLYDVDILTDARFDFTSPTFRVDDPMLENWRRLRGGYLTQLYRELRAALNEIDPGIQIAVQIPGDRAGTCLGNWHLDWRTWIDEGLVNELVVPVVLDQYEGYGPRAKLQEFGYIEGAVTVDIVRDFIRGSKQPTARVIQAGGPASCYQAPPPGADGWRLDSWPDLWTSNMSERWTQWRRDVNEFGHVIFLEQSFETFPTGDDGDGGGFGDYCYRPDLRSAPGYWQKLGDGTNSLPCAVDLNGNRVMKLTRAADGSANLAGRHHSRHDRGGYPFPGDTAVCSGKCRLEFRLLRPDAKSALVAYLQYDLDPEHRYDIGLFVTEGDPGAIHYREAGKNVPSRATLPIGEWQTISFDIDLQRRVYSAEIKGGEPAAQPRVICRDVAYSAKFNAFNMLDFSPQGATGSVLYLDDVSLRWTPAIMFDPPGKMDLLVEDFEKPLDPKRKLTGDAAVDSDISFGAGYRSLRLREGGGSVTLSSPKLMCSKSDRLLIDLDLFPKSDQQYIQIVPSTNTTGTDDVSVALFADDRSKPLVELRTRGSTWQHRGAGGGWVDSKHPVAFDAWHSLQFAIEAPGSANDSGPSAGQYRILMQVIGEPPRELCRGELGSPPKVGSMLSLELSCLRSLPRSDGPAFDNVQITRKISNP